MSWSARRGTALLGPWVTSTREADPFTKHPRHNPRRVRRRGVLFCLVLRPSVLRSMESGTEVEQRRFMQCEFDADFEAEHDT